MQKDIQELKNRLGKVEEQQVARPAVDTTRTESVKKIRDVSLGLSGIGLLGVGVLWFSAIETLLGPTGIAIWATSSAGIATVAGLTAMFADFRLPRPAK